MRLYTHVFMFSCIYVFMFLWFYVFMYQGWWIFWITFFFCVESCLILKSRNSAFLKSQSLFMWVKTLVMWKNGFSICMFVALNCRNALICSLKWTWKIPNFFSEIKWYIFEKWNKIKKTVKRTVRGQSKDFTWVKEEDTLFLLVFVEKKSNFKLVLAQ